MLTRRSALSMVAAGASAIAATRPAAAVARAAGPQYTTMADSATRAQVRAWLTKAGIAADRQQVFFSHVAQVAAALPATALTSGWAPLSQAATKYDPYAIQEAWAAKHPDFLGYNCRITAFGLFGDLVSVDPHATARTDLLLLDEQSLDADPAALLHAGDRARFDRLWSWVPTTSTLDVPTHVAALRRDWAARGVRFTSSSQARLISVVFHDTLDGDRLFVGHTGVLLPGADGFVFIEKLAFQEPYQVTRFRNRLELNDTLMRRYDIDRTGTMAKPFIMENGHLLPGYRPAPRLTPAPARRAFHHTSR